MKISRRKFFAPMGLSLVVPLAWADPQRKPVAYSYANTQCAECWDALYLEHPHGRCPMPESIAARCENKKCSNYRVEVAVRGQPQYRA